MFQTLLHNHIYLKSMIAEYIHVFFQLFYPPPTENGHHFGNDSFRHIFMKENICILIKISLKFVPKGPINNNPALI